LGNRIGAVVLHGQTIRRVPARTGRPHLSALLHSLLTIPRAGDSPRDGRDGEATDLARGITQLARVAQRRGLAVVISDFLAPDGWERQLRALAGRHDALAVEVVDPRELALPNVGLLSLVDPETGRRLEVQTASAPLRARYAAAATAQRAAIARSIRTAGADHLVLRTDNDWLLDMVRFVSGRRRRRAGVPRRAS